MTTRKQAAYLARFDARQERLRSMSEEDMIVHAHRNAKGEGKIDTAIHAWAVSWVVFFVATVAATGDFVAAFVVSGAWLLVSGPVLLLVVQQIREHYDLDR